MRTNVCSFIVVAGLCGVIGCGGSQSTTSSADKVLIYGRGADSVSLDPADASDGESFKVIENIFDTLVTYADNSADLVPCLATKWEQSDNRLEWIFTLREGVKFHDGTDLDADAVAFSFQRVLDPKHPDRYGIKAPFGVDFAVIDDIVVNDKRTVAFKLKRPSGIFVRNLAMSAAGIVSPAAVRKSKEKFRVEPVGTGPFRFSQWVPGEKLEIVANPDHWRGRPGVNRVIFKPIADNAARLLELQTGKIDLADELSIPSREQIRSDPNLKLLSRPGMNVGYLSLNCSRPPFDNPKVRRAIAHAIQKKDILTSALENQGQVATTPMPRTLWGHHSELRDYAYDPDKARQLLKEAGIPEGKKIQFWAMHDSRPYMPLPDRVAAIIQQQLRQVGLEPVIQSPPWAQYLDQTGKGEHEMCLLGWSTDNADPDNFLYALLDKDNAVPPDARNISFYKSEPLHKLLIDAQEETDQTKRIVLYKKAQEMIHDDCPMIPLTHVDVAAGLRKGVVGYELHPVGIIRLRLARLE